MLQETEAALQAGQHAERQDVDLEDANRVEVVLVPFDHLALFHRRLDDGDDFVEPILRDDETADMLGQVARKSVNLVGEIDDLASQRISLLQAGSFRFRFAELARPVPDGTGHRALRIVGKP